MPDVLDTLLQWVFPMDCAVCLQAAPDRHLPCFCRSCWESIEPLKGPMCPCCGRPFASPVALEYSPGHRCQSCRESLPAFDCVLCPYAFEGTLARAIHLFKYRKCVALARPLADLMLVCKDKLPAVDVVLPVPLHPKRLRLREFNQSLLLADRIATRLNLPLSFDNLRRVRATPPQTELHRAARAENVKHAFAVDQAKALQDQRVLLIDDVLTTGATVNECAKALRQAEVKAVVVWTVARRL